MDTLYLAVNASVLPFWLMLILAPKWKWSHILSSIVWPMALGALYAYLFSGGIGVGGFGSLRDLMTLFTQPFAVVAGWIHYCAIDLFVGGWLTRDAMRIGIPRWQLIPCQVLTMVMAPVGLLAYLALRGVTKGQWEPGA